jgi:oligogalacturonide transporter
MKKLTLGRKLAFAACDVLGGGAFNIINFLYPVFLALTVGLSAYWISVIMLVARIWDAVIDPLIGQLSDSTKSRLGKRRIFLVVGAPLMLAAMFFMFYPYYFESMTVRALAVLGSYLLFCAVQSVIMVPYYSLSCEISGDYNERASANSWRLGFSIFSSIVCVAVPGMIVNAYSGNKGYTVMALIFGGVFCLCALVTGLFAKEEIQEPPVRLQLNFKPLFKLLKLKPFRQYIGMMSLLQVTMVVMSGLFFFYIDFYYCRELTAAGTPNHVGLFAAASMFAMQIVALPFYLRLIKKTGKIAAYRLGTVIWIVTGLLLLTLPAGAPAWQIIALGMLMGFGISGPGLAPHTMLGDVADAARLAFGERSDGAIGGMVNFISTVSQAIGLSAAMAVLGYFGFQQADPGQVVLAQPQSAQTAIRILMSCTPLVLMGIATLISYRYVISSAKHKEIKDAIAKNKRPAKLLKELLPNE